MSCVRLYNVTRSVLRHKLKEPTFLKSVNTHTPYTQGAQKLTECMISHAVSNRTGYEKILHRLRSIAFPLGTAILFCCRCFVSFSFLPNLGGHLADHQTLPHVWWWLR